MVGQTSETKPHRRPETFEPVGDRWVVQTRWRRRRDTGVAVLWRACEKCGEELCAHGYEFGSREHPLGRWFCGEHLPRTDRSGRVLDD